MTRSTGSRTSWRETASGRRTWRPAATPAVRGRRTRMADPPKRRLRTQVGADTDERFLAWAGAVRACVEAVEPVANEAREKERVLRALLRGPAPDAAAIGALVIE